MDGQSRSALFDTTTSELPQRCAQCPTSCSQQSYHTRVVASLQRSDASTSRGYVQAMAAVLRECERRSGLAQEMLQALQSGRERERGVDEVMQRLKRCGLIFIA